MFAALTGGTVGGALPRGFVQYRDGSSNQLRVFVRFLNLPDGTVLNVFVGSTNVGQLTLQDNGNGQISIDAASLTIASGTNVSLRNGNMTILSGTFFCIPARPLPSPNFTILPFPSPRISPSPSGTPPTKTQGRFFDARLSGSQVVPAVSINARGVANIILNADATQIQVFAGFFNLSSNQTGKSICSSLAPKSINKS